jgi:NCS1 family nucleobase:cation symporter-1
LDSVGGTLFALVVVLVATLSVNIAVNVVSPAYDLCNLLPRFVTFRTGALITGVVGIAIMPWRLIANPHVYIFTWPVGLGSALLLYLLLNTGRRADGRR